MPSRILSPAFLLLIFLVLPSNSLAAQITQPQPISRSTFGQYGDQDSIHPAISSDGRFVVFESRAGNLVQVDSNGLPDIYIHDRQNGQIGLVSITPQGTLGNGASTRPAISGNGRFVAFQSEADNLVAEDTNQAGDIFVFDRLTNSLKRVSIGMDGQQADKESRNVTISDDGRFLAYETLAENLLPGDDNAASDVYIFDQVTQNVIRASVSSEGRGGNEASWEARISGDGRIVAYTSAADNLVSGDSNGQADVFTFNRVLKQTERISIGPSGEQSDRQAGSASISNSGRSVLFQSSASGLAPGTGQGLNLFRRDRQDGLTLLVQALDPQVKTLASEMAGDGSSAVTRVLGEDGEALLLRLPLSGQPAEILWSGSLDPVFDLNADGDAVVFAAPRPGRAGPRQIWVVQGSPQQLSFHIAGRVTDGLGHPLSLVTIQDSEGRSVRTDAEGYFYLSDYGSGPQTLTPQKDGFKFQPENWNLSIFRDVAGYHFSASPEEELLKEARKDLGMPYSFNRGCENGEVACGGPFHGFYAGFCTDLVLDAYTFALDFDIDFALEQDAYAHPGHFYRWRNARNTHDMWRYFHYSGQMLPHEDNYLPGDIVFFDWSRDGEIDHVALVSEVEAGRPAGLLDATGVIDQNPSGLAAELDWVAFHEDTVRGHARWTGRYEPVRSGFDPGTHVFQMALSGSSVFLRLMDAGGNAISFGEMGIPQGLFYDLEWEEVISVLDPEGVYTAEIRAVGSEIVPYQFSFQTVSDGIITGLVSTTSKAAPGEVYRFDFYIQSGPDGRLTMEIAYETRQEKPPGAFRKP